MTESFGLHGSSYFVSLYLASASRVHISL